MKDLIAHVQVFGRIKVTRSGQINPDLFAMHNLPLFLARTSCDTEPWTDRFPEDIQVGKDVPRVLVMSSEIPAIGACGDSRFQVRRSGNDFASGKSSL
jgi:hypothetical protein